MYLFFDIGNTNINFALCDMSGNIVENHLVQTNEFINSSKTVIDNLKLKINNKIVEKCVFVSVVPHVSQILKSELQGFCGNVYEFIPENQKTIRFDYINPGADRIAAVLGAVLVYPDSDVIVIDAGTAITVDLVTKEKEFKGVAIVPGLNTSLMSLSNTTANLPYVDLSFSYKFPVQTTVDSINNGVGMLYSGGLHRIVEFILQHFPSSKQVLTGGNARYVSKTLAGLKPDHIPDLIFKGLYSFIVNQKKLAK
jgi:type III pantothenate kinase